MAQTTLFPPAEIPKVQTGDVFLLGGRHRLMCGDATDKAAVAHLFGDDAPTLVVTSPPYAKQRDYDRPISCWDALMLDSLSRHNFAENVQILCVLGPVHAKGEWTPYWLRWLGLMQEDKWQICGQYIWDKIKPSFGENQGRCRSDHEYVFHLRKNKVLLNSIIPNKSAGIMANGKNTRDANGRNRSLCSPGPVKAYRPPTSIFRCMPAFTNRTMHPAVFPVDLASQLIRARIKEHGIVYDPFSGSGTTLLATEEEDVTGLAMEISSAYCQIALRRWVKEHPDKPIRKL